MIPNPNPTRGSSTTLLKPLDYPDSAKEQIV